MPKRLWCRGLVNDARVIIDALDSVTLDDAQADAVGLLALIAGQDVEPDDEDGTWRIAERVAADRVISTVDAESRHMHKSVSSYRDGYKAHVACRCRKSIAGGSLTRQRVERGGTVGSGRSRSRVVRAGALNQCIGRDWRRDKGQAAWRYSLMSPPQRARCRTARSESIMTTLASSGAARSRDRWGRCWLYRHGWGWMLGHTFLLLVHVGRKTGKPHDTVAMALSYDRDHHEAIILSGWGPDADWVHNLQAHPALEVRIGRESFVPEHRFLTEDEAVAVVTDFRRRHPWRVRLASAILGCGNLRSDAVVRRFVHEHPFVSLRPAR